MSRVILALFVSMLLPSPSVAGKPNVVLFLAEGLGWSDCSPCGGKEIRTPNMAWLAREGMTFLHAFVASPSCAPSWPRAEVKKWPAYFQARGYAVAAIGKVAHYAQVKEYGFNHVSHFVYRADDCIEAAAARLGKRRSTTAPTEAAAVSRYLTRPAEELHDLIADSWELRNLAAEPAHASTLKTLRDDLDIWMKEQGDEGLRTECALPDPSPGKKEKR